MRLSFGYAALVLLAAGCADDAPPLTDATSLLCPAPGALPFRLESSGWAGNDEQIVRSKPRDKAEAGDALGNPGGPIANVYLADDQAPGTAFAFHGVKGHTGTTNGLFSTPLADEAVSLWHYDVDADAWSSLGRTTTDADGVYDVAVDMPQANDEPVYAMLEADGSCAEHYTYLWPPGTKVVVSDIDGTLTASDAELQEETADPAYVQKTKTKAVELTQAWAAKGYPVIYLTARPHVYRLETRRWLRDLGFAPGPAITANSLADPSVYKTLWLERMFTTFGWVPVAAYGNATTDITAYENAQIPKAATFIIGEYAGASGTVAIPNDDYTDHIATFVEAQPAQ